MMQPPDSYLSEIPTILFGTDSGAIGMVATLPHDQYCFLEKLQENLRNYMKPDLSQEWRSFDHGTLGDDLKAASGESFLNGDLIELFLALTPSEQKKVSLVTNVPVQDIIEKVEELRKLRR